MDAEELELLQRICKRYERITGRPKIGLSDIVLILCGPDMRSYMKDYIDYLEKEANEGR